MSTQWTSAMLNSYHFEAKTKCAGPLAIAEMLLEPVSADRDAERGPVTMNMVASVTMNEGRCVLTTMKPLSRPTATAASEGEDDPDPGVEADNIRYRWRR